MSSPLPGLPAAAPLVIRPSRGWISLKLKEVWEYRELLYFLIWRDVKVRYKQTVLGAAWAILQPVATMIVFTIFFGRLANVGSDGLPYPLFSYAGLLPWTFFAQALSQSSDSLVGSGNLIKKVYFPRLVIPASSALAPIVDFAIAMLVLIGMMIYYGVWPSAAVLYLPLLLLLAFGTALGVGMWLAALNVQYRDIRYVVPFFVQLWLFVTPVIYPMSQVTKKLQAMGLPGWLYGLNPMAGVVEGFRWALLGTGSKPGPVVLASAGVTLLLLISGAMYFRRMEKMFADVV
ncbi:MAG: ABC transporter permease [Acidobacteriota bacterium]|nr:ABC transporter permease [Acidobacteriota bacterium]